MLFFFLLISASYEGHLPPSVGGQQCCYMTAMPNARANRGHSDSALDCTAQLRRTPDAVCAECVHRLFRKNFEKE